jgi:hypothetical protein
LNDPIPDTLLDAATGALISPPATGKSALLDQFSITKPDVSGSVPVRLSAPPTANLGGELLYSVVVSNHSTIALNGAQIRLSVQGSDIVNTIGRLAPGATRTVQLKARVASTPEIKAAASLVSATALPVQGNSITTRTTK